MISLRVPGSTLDSEFPAARVGDGFFRGSGTSQATAVVSGDGDAGDEGDDRPHPERRLRLAGDRARRPGHDRHELVTQIRPGEDLARALADEVFDEVQLVEPEAVPEPHEAREQQQRPENGVRGDDAGALPGSTSARRAPSSVIETAE